VAETEPDSGAGGAARPRPARARHAVHPRRCGAGCAGARRIRNRSQRAISTTCSVLQPSPGTRTVHPAGCAGTIHAVSEGFFEESRGPRARGGTSRASARRWRTNQASEQLQPRRNRRRGRRASGQRRAKSAVPVPGSFHAGPDRARPGAATERPSSGWSRAGEAPAPTHEGLARSPLRNSATSWRLRRKTPGPLPCSSNCSAAAPDYRERRGRVAALSRRQAGMAGPEKGQSVSVMSAPALPGVLRRSRARAAVVPWSPFGSKLLSRPLAGTCGAHAQQSGPRRVSGLGIINLWAAMAELATLFGMRAK